MRPRRVWHRVGPPTWKRSGTIVFAAVLGVLLIGGTAMAANLGLLTSATPRERGYRLEVPRPALSVSLPPTTSTSSSIESTSSSAGRVGNDDDDLEADDGRGVDGTDRSSDDQKSSDDHGRADESDDDTADRADDADDDVDDDADHDDDHDDDDSSSRREADDSERGRSVSDAGGAGGGPRPLPAGDGRLDDD